MAMSMFDRFIPEKTSKDLFALDIWKFQGICCLHDKDVSALVRRNQTMKEAYIEAIGVYGQTEPHILFTRMSELFVRTPDTNTGLGSYYLVDLVAHTKGGDCGMQVVSVFCENHNIPVLVKYGKNVPIREIVRNILEDSPPRCAILIDIRDNELMHKVRTRISRTQCDLRYKRIIFCIADQVMPAGSSVTSLYVPGTIDDKVAMLLYHLPPQMRTKDVSLFHPLAEAMTDYTLFQPRVWRNVNVDGTLDAFLSTALYQVVRRVRTDTGAEDAFPTFETEWRNTMATRLKNTLMTPPEALCPSIHRVIPIGVLPQDALHAVCVAIPMGLQSPYAITVAKSAVNDQCGSIAITQPMQQSVVHIYCIIDPGLLGKVCRELRVGHKAVVSSMQAMQIQHKEASTELRGELAILRSESAELKGQLSLLRNEMTTLVKHLSKQNHVDTHPKIEHNCEESVQCTKPTCSRAVTKRFRSGKFHRQCSVCLSRA
jgi:hypothetical protein